MGYLGICMWADGRYDMADVRVEVRLGVVGCCDGCDGVICVPVPAVVVVLMMGSCLLGLSITLINGVYLIVLMA